MLKWEGWSLGGIIALLVLIALFVLLLVGKVTLLAVAIAAMFLAIARLV